MASGDPAQLQPYHREYQRHLCQEALKGSVIDKTRGNGYPILQLNVQHRAIDGQFDVVYEQFYSNFQVHSIGQ